MQILDQQYWQNKYLDKNTGWDIGNISTPLKVYIDQIKDKSLKILIPGAGNAYEAQYLYINGFQNVFLLDWAKEPLVHFQERVPDFPKNQLIQKDFFEYSNDFDLIIEQTFFCALNPSKRVDYVNHMHQLLKDGGKLVGLFFNRTFEKEGPPFGGSANEYLKLFTDRFKIAVLEECYNSIEPRKGSELFFIFKKLERKQSKI